MGAPPVTPAQRKKAMSADFDDIVADRAGALESSVEKFFVKEAEEYRCVQKKVIGVRSWPDRDLLWPAGTTYGIGITDYVELKRPKGGRYEKGQKELLQALRDAGHHAVTLSTKQQVRRFFIERAAMLGVPKRPPIPKELRDGSLNAVEYAAALKRKP